MPPILSYACIHYANNQGAWQHEYEMLSENLINLQNIGDLLNCLLIREQYPLLQPSFPKLYSTSIIIVYFPNN